MRVTAETKASTRSRIIHCAARLFERKGFEKSTTRDIARAAKIAAGTLFNYFPHKEAVGLCIAAHAMQAAYDEFDSRSKSKSDTLEEALFSFMASCLHHLNPCRHFLLDVMESTLSPLSRTGDEAASAIRAEHLERVRKILTSHFASEGVEPSIVTLHLYWTLFLGVLAFWAQDDSRNQENTVALLDQYTALFVGSLSNAEPSTEIKS